MVKLDLVYPNLKVQCFNGVEDMLDFKPIQSAPKPNTKCHENDTVTLMNNDL